MLDRVVLYNLIYALAAKDGREAALFGNCAPLASEAFARSLPSSAFPELWFEIPLSGEPWFDLHALASRSGFTAEMAFASEAVGGQVAAFEWFARQGDDVRQLALSWDVSSGDITSPAVQLLMTRENVSATCSFLEIVGRPDATTAFRTFLDRIPKGWYACYTGVFPGRLGQNFRVECIPEFDLEKAYAADARLLEDHLRQTGLDPIDETLIAWCSRLAQAPFQLEFQFDVTTEGAAASTFGASVRFAIPPGTETHQHFDPNGAAGDLMKEVEGWGLADERWRLLADTMFAKCVEHKGESALTYCCPAFLKLRWRDGSPLDAKAYLIAGVENR